MITHLFGATVEDPTRRRISIWRDSRPGQLWWAACPCHDEPASFWGLNWKIAMEWAELHIRTEHAGRAAADTEGQQ